ncbi:MAG TPA: MtnX-like HAD-IB family phosphatase [Terriglobia bacterium]|nr:MtnX-like HAD-IB family phosphatase [Terriglobia bacterium]
MNEGIDHNFRASDSRLLTPVIFSDFDGTIAQVDVTDVILSEFGDPAWREIEEEWVAGCIGSRECLRRQMALVRASAVDFDALIDTVPHDLHFPAFHRLTRALGLPFYVVSDGFDYVIRRVLRNCGVDGDLLNGSHLFASSIKVAGGLTVDFPHWPAPCVHGCATCKPEVIRRVRGDHAPVIFIGDGLSDRFAVEEADVVFAKDKLLAYCRKNSIGCTPFQTFADIQAELARIGAFPRPARAGREQQVSVLSR